MKIKLIKSIQTKLKLTLLGIFCLSALNIFADNKVVNTDTGSDAESNLSYNDSDPALSALNVSGNGIAYEGANIILAFHPDHSSSPG